MFKPDDPLAPNGPTFAEPWQAQVLAIADTLITSGSFSAKNWAHTLGTALKDAATRGEPDTPETYYQCALGALETLVAGTTQIDRTMLAERKERWERAYLATRHGQPVKLEAG